MSSTPSRVAPLDRVDPHRLAALRAAAESLAPAVIDLTTRIAAVPAPTGDEGERAAVVAAMLRDAGLPVSTDPLGDVLATLPGVNRGRPPVVLAAHTDTVFPRATPLQIRREGERVLGPGVGDNSLGVAALVSLPALLRAAGFAPAVDVVLAADVGEEGLGNLRGMRAVMDAYPNAGAVIAIEGHNLGRLTHVAVGSRRLRVTATGPGGHSWGDAGRPSAIHALARVVADLGAMPIPRAPKSSLNVGTFVGGVSVNTIAPVATCVIDLRSVDAPTLTRLGERVDRIIEAANRDGVAFTRDILGERPAGVVPLESSIVRLATGVLSALGVETSYDASSTDANVPISRGIPAVCVGLTSGGNVHREDEWIAVDPIPTGLAQLGLLTLALADELAAR